MTEKEIVEEIVTLLDVLIKDVEMHNSGFIDSTYHIDVDRCKEILGIYRSRYESKVSPQEFMNAWNSYSVLPSIKAMSADRKRALSQRAREQFFIDNYFTGISRVAESSFCTGQNDRGWKATVDFFLRPGSLAKIMEGKYDDKVAQTQRINNAVNDTSLAEHVKQFNEAQEEESLF